MSRHALGGLAALVLFLGCTEHVRHIETTPAGHHVRWISDATLPERNYVLLEPLPGGVRAHARAAGLCGQELIVVKHREEVMDIRAADARWVGAGALLAAATLVYFWGEPASRSVEQTEVSLALAAGAAAAILVPMAVERRKRTSLGYEHEVVPAPPVTCRERPLPGARIVLRDKSGAHEGTTDAAGMTVMSGLDVTSVRAAYLDESAIPWALRAPR